MQPTEFLEPNCFLLCAPDGPGTPFGSPLLIFLDVVRILIMVMGLVVIVWTPRLVMDAKALGQKCRLFGQCCFAIIVIGTEVDHIGDYSHYRLFLTFLGVVFILYGITQMRKESTLQVQPEHRTG